MIEQRWKGSLGGWRSVVDVVTYGSIKAEPAEVRPGIVDYGGLVPLAGESLINLGCKYGKTEVLTSIQMLRLEFQIWSVWVGEAVAAFPSHPAGRDGPGMGAVRSWPTHCRSQFGSSNPPSSPSTCRTDTYNQDPIRKSSLFRIDGDGARPIPSLRPGQGWGWSHASPIIGRQCWTGMASSPSRQGPTG
jgi:hypothetical protein